MRPVRNGGRFARARGVGVFRCARVVRIDPVFYAFYCDHLTALSFYASLPKGEGAAVLSDRRPYV